MYRTKSELVAFKVRQAVGSMAIEGIRVPASVHSDMMRVAKGQASVAEVILHPVFPAFDRVHLCRIHGQLFGDVYPWVGELRISDTGKGAGLQRGQAM